MSVKDAERIVRVFVSSPVDVAPERGRVQAVAAKLNRDYEGLVRFETVLWEDHFYKADRSFQPQIPESIACDVLVSIFWTRVGTELPADFPRMPNGKPYPSGTAYELLTALEASRDKGVPDVYVFRKTADAVLPTTDYDRRRQAQTQLDALEAFWNEWFKSEQGHFKAAFQTFPTTDAFERQVEQLLRQWLESHSLLGPRLRWPKEKGSPFRGLAPFEAEHAAVFFGRDRAIDEAQRRLSAAAEHGTPFLLIVGPSGSGKSSLARAGLIPRLTTPGVVASVEVWRTAIMKPSEGQAGPMASLAAALLTALPELEQGDFPNAAALTDNLQRGGTASVRPIVGALTRIAEAAQQQRHSERPLNSALALLVDQLEELFAQAIDDEERTAFAQALRELVATGNVWCIATLRADLYEELLKEPLLKGLKETGGSFDLGPPGPAELAEIVHAPAAAAGLVLEAHAEKGPLDERLLVDAKSADSLPLLQFTLRQLYEQRRESEGETQLTHAAYEALGGLQGAIAAEAERAVATLPPRTLDALPRLLRQLAEPAREGNTLTLRDVSQADVTTDATEAALVRALLGARILIARQDAAGRPTLRLAHDAVLASWPKAQAAAQASREFYRIRAEVEDALLRWRENGGTKDRLIQPGVPLAEAEKLVADFRGELPADLVAFVGNSRNRARARQRLVAASAAVFLVVALLAGWQWFEAITARNEVQRQSDEVQRQRDEAQRQRDRAENSLALATEAANGLVRDLANKLRFATGVPTAMVKDIIEKARELQDRLINAGEATPDLRWSQSAALIEYARALFLLGDSSGALKTAQQARDIAKSLQETALADTRWAPILMGSYQTIAVVFDAQNRNPDALAAYREQLAVARAMVEKYPNDMLWSGWLAVSYRGIGGSLSALGELEEALAAYREELKLRRALAAEAPNDTEAQRGLSGVLGALAEVLRKQDRFEDALTQLREVNGILQRLILKEPNNTLLQDDLLLTHNRVGNILKAQKTFDRALSEFREARVIAEALVRDNPGNSRWQSDLAITLENIGSLHAEQNQDDEAIPAYRAAITIRRTLADKDRDNPQWQRNFVVTAGNLADALRRTRDYAGALEICRDLLAFTEQPANDNSADPEAQFDVAQVHNKIADLLKDQGHLPEALQSYQSSLAIIQRLANADSNNPRWQSPLYTLHRAIGNVLYAQKNYIDTLQPYRDALAIADAQAKAKPGDVYWKRELAGSYYFVGSALQALGKLPEALVNYRESLVLSEQLVQSDPDNIARQRELWAAYISVAGVLEAQNNVSEAVAVYRQAIAVIAKVVATEPENGTWTRSWARTLDAVGDFLRKHDQLVEAYPFYRDSLAVWQRFAALDPNDKQRQDDFARKVRDFGGMAYSLVLARAFAPALEAADRALALLPDQIWIYTNRAHALLFLGRVEDARALYLKYRDEKNVQGKTWPVVILEDFAELRKAGLTHPLMDEIEKEFRSAS